MFDKVFPFLIQYFSRIVSFIFNLPINENPNITFGEFLLTFAFIGIVIYFIFGSDFFPNIIHVSNSNIKNNINNNQSKHARKE